VQLAICWNIRASCATSIVPRRRYRDNVTGADNQQERPLRSEGILRDCMPAASSTRGEDTVRAPRRRGEVDRDDRPAGAPSSSPSRARKGAASNRPERNSLSGKHTHLPRRLVRGGREPAHIGETLLPTAEGDPEGSPSDPLTTDPKGEACRNPGVRKSGRHAIRRPSSERQGTYGVAATLDPWYVTGLTEGEGCFCIAFALRAKMRTGLEVRPSFALSLNERDVSLLRGLQAFFGCGWIRESKGDRTFKYEVRAIGELTGTIVPHFERFPLAGDKLRSCAGFSRACRMVEQGDHLRRDGLREIVDIAYRVSAGKRRHSQATLLSVLDEAKV
jgi:LAGLIDADG endonuclease